MEKEPLRIVIVEDSDRVHEVLVAVLHGCGPTQLVGRAIAEAPAIELIARERPDLVLLDLALRPGSGFAVLRAIRDAGCAARVLVVSNQATDEVRLRCIGWGADGVFDKTHELDALASHIAALAAANRPAPAVGGVDGSPSGLEKSQARLQDIVARAAAITGCPMAAVTLLDASRQWFVASVGIPVASTSRHLAFCSYTVAARSLLEVRDATLDPRFSSNMLVQAPIGLRYYAGVPLLQGAAGAVGALCVLDTTARALDAAQRDALESLAAEAALELARLQGNALVAVQAGGAEEQRSTGRGEATLPDRMLALAMAAARDDAAWSGAVALDLDDLAGINHALGRAAGDRVIETVAQRVEAECPPGGIAARTGGDEFALLVPVACGYDSFSELAAALSVSIARPIDVGSHPVQMRCSIGVAAAAPGDTPPVLLANAELAVQHAKQQGGGFCQAYAPSMGRRAIDRLTLASELRAGIASGEIELFYQPQHDLVSGQLTGLEALARWRHPERGLLTPDAFIGIAEASGQIVELGAAVLEMAVAQIAAWHVHGFPPPRLAVNVSALQLTPAFTQAVVGALQRHGVSAAALEIEVTETALPRSDEEALQVLHTLRAAGVRIAVDDFGTGHSSLTMLQRLPVSTLKIDRAFIGPLAPSSPEQAIVAGVVSIARVLGLWTVAEGVETPAQAACLRMLGCDQAQGYLYARPMPADAITRLLVRREPLPTPEPRGAADGQELSHGR